MAADYVKIYCNGIHVRTFGGNKKAVRVMRQLYKGMNKNEFLRKHPKFTELCKDQFKLNVY